MDSFSSLRLRFDSLEVEIARLNDSVITLAATILGFSLIFLTITDTPFDEIDRLKTCWILLAISLMTGINSRLVHILHRFISLNHAADLVIGRHEDQPVNFNTLPGNIVMVVHFVLLGTALLTFGVGLIWLLQFGFANVAALGK